MMVLDVGTMNHATSSVKTGYDPRVFEWHSELSGIFTRGEMAMMIYPKEIRVLSGAGEKFLSVAQKGPDGFYRAAIGVAPKAIAIRPMAPGHGGLRVRKSDKSSALYIAATNLISTMGFDLPVRMLAVWDEEHKMLVGMQPERIAVR